MKDENDDNDGELKRDVCAVLCCPGVARLSWGLLASPVLVSAPCALLGSPALSCAVLARALLGTPALASLGFLLCSPAEAVEWLISNMQVVYKLVINLL